MGPLNLDAPEKTEDEINRERKDQGIRAGVIVGSVCLAAAYASLTYDPLSGDPKLRGRLAGQLADIIGATLGLLVVPAIAALIAKNRTDKWHYVFGVVFLVLLVGRIALKLS